MPSVPARNDLENGGDKTASQVAEAAPKAQQMELFSPTIPAPFVEELQNMRDQKAEEYRSITAQILAKIQVKNIFESYAQSG